MLAIRTLKVFVGLLRRNIFERLQRIVDSTDITTLLVKPEIYMLMHQHSVISRRRFHGFGLPVPCAGQPFRRAVKFGQVPPRQGPVLRGLLARKRKNPSRRKGGGWSSVLRITWHPKTSKGKIWACRSECLNPLLLSSSFVLAKFYSKLYI